MADTPLKGYPTEVGNKIRMIWDHTGPASYSNIGTSSGTGDVINVSQFAYGGFETVEGAFGLFTEGYTQSGNFLVKAFTGSSGTTPSVSLPTGDAFPKIVLQWFTTGSAFGSIGSEVANGTNLAAELIRLGSWMV
jgi:hypothetical protein